MRFTTVFATLLLPAIAPAMAQTATIPEIRYDGQLVVRVAPRGMADVRLLERISGDRWSCGTGGPTGEVDYRISLSDLPALRVAGVAFEVVIPDLQTLIDTERAERESPVRAGGFFDSFPNAAATDSYVNSLATSNPDFVTRISLGQSLEGREIYGIRITSPVPPIGGSPRKPVIFLNSLQHAREWITLTTNLYVATQLLALYPTDPVIHAGLDRYEIVVVPLTNPDGFNITWSFDRYWRKNARTVTKYNTLAGVDTNRNWSVGWGLNNGSSPAYNSETYRGLAAFSEPETQALRNYMLSVPKLAAHIDFHSYASLILRPWSYQYVTPPGLNALTRVGQAMSSAVKNGTNVNYTVGGPEVLYLASGTAPDWSYGTTGCISFTMEMNNRYGGGFSPPAYSIVPSGGEGLLAVRALLQGLCPADLNLDNVVDDADFSLFAGAYDQLLDNKGDLTGDGMTDDTDFSMFVQAYDRLTCP